MCVAEHPLVDELARLDAALHALSGEVAHLEERLRAGDKSAFKTAKFRRGELFALRQQRSELERRLRRTRLRAA